MKKLYFLPIFAALVFAAHSSHAQVILNEPFTYADGDLLTVSGGAWTTHSGTTPLFVVGGAAFVDQNDATGGRQDDNRLFSQAFDVATDNTSKIYASFTVNFSALPFNTGVGTTAGSYFAHLKSSVANEFYARIGANQEGVADPLTQFRLAIANEIWGNGTTVKFPQDLSLNTTYNVFIRLDLATDQSTLWVDPVNEASTSVTATDVISYAAGSMINSFALRQGTSATTGGPGDVYVDNLLVGLSFADVVPEPAGLFAFGALGLLAWTFLRRRN